MNHLHAPQAAGTGGMTREADRPVTREQRAGGNMDGKRSINRQRDGCVAPSSH